MRSRGGIRTMSVGRVSLWRRGSSCCYRNPWWRIVWCGLRRVGVRLVLGVWKPKGVLLILRGLLLMSVGMNARERQKSGCGGVKCIGTPSAFSARCYWYAR